MPKSLSDLESHDTAPRTWWVNLKLLDRHLYLVKPLRQRKSRGQNASCTNIHRQIQVFHSDDPISVDLQTPFVTTTICIYLAERDKSATRNWHRKVKRRKLRECGYMKIHLRTRTENLAATVGETRSTWEIRSNYANGAWDEGKEVGIGEIEGGGFGERRRETEQAER